MSVPSSASGTPPAADRARDAQRIAGSLRVCRLTTLYGAAGSGKTDLVRQGVLPLLHRRASDIAVPQELAPRVVIPFADRRRAASAFAGARSAEVAIFFDSWGAAPLAQLQIQVHEALGIAAPAPATSRLSLAGGLAALNMQFGARFLFIFDQFEACLAASQQLQPGARDFIDELVQALNRPLLPVNVLLVVRDDAKFLLDGLRIRVPGFDDQSLQLGEAHRLRAAPPMLRQVPASRQAAEAAPAESPAASPSPVPDAPETEEDWYRAVGAIVTRAAVAARPDHRRDAEPAPAPVLSPDAAAVGQVDNVPTAQPPLDDVATEDDAAWAPTRLVPEEEDAPALSAPVFSEPNFSSPNFSAPTDDDQPEPPPARPVRRKVIRRPVALGLGAAAVLLLLGYVAWLQFAAIEADNVLAVAASTTPPRPAVPAPVASPVARSVAPPTHAIVPAPAPAPALAPVGIDASPRALTELGEALATVGAAPPATPWPAGFTAVPGRPGLAVARYDALQAARQRGTAAALQVVAPLYTEELYFVVRADSPLNHIHDIENAAINIGPADSSRAVTAAVIYQRLFGHPLRSKAAAAWGSDAALGQLLAGQGVDVLVFAGPQPVPWVAGLPAATARDLKLLKLDPNHPADQRALQAYLPARLRDGTPTLAVMSFLVAADARLGASAAEALCAALPALQQGGQPKWRELQAGLQLETGWPTSAAVQQAWRACAARRP